MTTLTTAQRNVLQAAACRADGHLEPLPAHLKGGAATKVIHALLSAGLITEAPHAITPAGRAAIGEAPAADALARAPNLPQHATATPAASNDTLPAQPAPTPRRRANSKQAQLIAMLASPEGATVAEIAARFGWLPHTARGVIAGALKKKLGLAVTSTKVAERGRIYHLSRPAAV